MTKDELNKIIQRMFPHIRNPDNISTLIIVAMKLGATSRKEGKKRKSFEKYGITSYMIFIATKLGLLEKNISGISSFPVSTRYSNLKEVNLDNLVDRELKGLFNHMDNEPTIIEPIRKSLNFSGDMSLDEIKEYIMSGSTNEKISNYDKVFCYLRDNNLHNKNYDYFHVCFRFRAKKYWLSNLAKDMLNVT